ncbi:uncharacterized protein LOC124551230 [Schistocerca americana]|uniref:uncharacterized protein LOC124551230 n=1 Tax=Schistocerca americana TaxID=7009 RepID=UPI001F4F48D1|nr:uncharacterized protein LOC124551230 [Schistocerca americana]
MLLSGQMCVLLLVLEASADSILVLQCFCHHPELLSDRGIITTEADSDVRSYCDAAAGMIISLNRNTTCDDVMRNRTFSTTAGELVRRIVQKGIRKPEKDASVPGRDVCHALLSKMKPISKPKVRALLCEAASAEQRVPFAHWTNKTEWNEQDLKNDDQRNCLVERVLDINSRISEAITNNVMCYYLNKAEFDLGESTIAAEAKILSDNYHQYMTTLVQHRAELISFGINNTMHNFVPLALEGIGRTLPKERLQVWVRQMGKLAEWFRMRLNAVVEDIVAINEETDRMKLDAVDPNPGRYAFPLALLSERLLTYHRRPLPLQEAFGKQCGKQIPEGPEMLQLIETLHMYLIIKWFQLIPYNRGLTLSRDFTIKGEKSILGDQSNVVVSVDTSCVQLMVDMIALPTCPMEDLPQGTVNRHRECRTRLTSNLVHRVSHIPVTSYLAYTQRVNINICLLSWIVSNERSICHDVHTGIVKSVNDMYCVLSNSREEVCAQLNAKDGICSISRSMLWLMCPSFHRDSFESLFPRRDDVMVFTFDTGPYKCEPYWRPSVFTSIYKWRRNVVKYLSLKTDFLQPLEVTLISLNVVFRVLTAGVYGCIPKLRNVPGKLLLCFQITGLVQIVLSEIVHRFANALDLQTIVQLDSSLTVLSCLWLNSFCYEMLKCVRQLSLPDQLSQGEARRVFRKHVLCVSSLWTTVSTAMIVLERVDDTYIFHSRVLFFVAICLSILFNSVVLVMVWDLYLRNRSSMKQLDVTTKLKLGSKRRLAFLIAKMCIFSGLGVFIRVAFHQIEGLPQAIYYVHLVSMLQGPAFFVLIVCNDTTLPLLKNSLLQWWNPGVQRPGQEQGSAAMRNWQRRKRHAEADAANTAV